MYTTCLPQANGATQIFCKTLLSYHIQLLLFFYTFTSDYRFSNHLYPYCTILIKASQTAPYSAATKHTLILWLNPGRGRGEPEDKVRNARTNMVTRHEKYIVSVYTRFNCQITPHPTLSMYYDATCCTPYVPSVLYIGGYRPAQEVWSYWFTVI